eukprot:TRINITY_DN144_c0_g1_i6.p1 TRINITY_DN144_c0_g1~~TRINITY_DN144_c0_g1_i6.p1  ORF type:complete len:164 (-),score=1.19 TRINITY_DN144_c0_g1_i6:431-922(-)
MVDIKWNGLESYLSQNWTSLVLPRLLRSSNLSSDLSTCSQFSLSLSLPPRLIYPCSALLCPFPVVSSRIVSSLSHVPSLLSLFAFSHFLSIPSLVSTHLSFLLYYFLPPFSSRTSLLAFALPVLFISLSLTSLRSSLASSSLPRSLRPPIVGPFLPPLSSSTL